MKGLGRRFMFYFLGFGMGCVIVWAMFYRNQDRDSWLPEGRVLDFIEEHPLQINEKAQCQINCFNIDTNTFNKAFWEAANVNFKESATKRKPCPEYKITYEGLVMYIEICEEEETATLRSIVDIIEKDKGCGCE